MVDETTSSVETTEDFGQDEGGVVARWLAEIKAYDASFKPWSSRSEKIVKRYRDERENENDSTKRFNILWANTETLKPALYTQAPMPNVSRRNKDRDPIGRAASQILERCVSYSMDTYDFSAVAKAGRDDYLLTARGQVWVRYVPHHGEEVRDRTRLQTIEGEDGLATYQDDDGSPVEKPMFDEESKPYVEGEPYRPVVYEEVVCDHIAWGDFGHTPAPKWDKVTAVWKRELLTRQQLIDRFGEEIGNAVSLTKKLEGVDDAVATRFGDAFKRGEVFEIWDKTDKRVIWVSPGYTDKPLDAKPDPLRLRGFFPCPKPLYGTITTDSLIPVPDYVQYQSQALELDVMTQRISLLMKTIKVAAAYDASTPGLERIVEGEDNTMVPVDSWAMFAEKGGIAGAMSFLPIKEIAEVATSLIANREQLKNEIYQLTGLSDIVRGQATGPKATATEQRIKGQWASIRLQDRQDDMARFLRDVVRIKSEIIAEHFEPETMAEMSGWLQSPDAQQIDRHAAEVAQKRQQAIMAAMQASQVQGGPGMAPAGQMPPLPGIPEPVPNAKQVFDQAVQLLRDDRLRTFRVDIETDTTIAGDEQEEKKNRTEFLTAVTGFLAQALPAGQANPALRPMLSEMLMFGVRGFKAGRQMEAVMEETLDALAEAPPPPQVEPPEAIRAKADVEKAQIEDKRHGEKMQIEREKAVQEKQDRDRAFELEVRKLTDAAAARQEQRQHALDDRRLDGKMTPTMEDDMKEVAAALAQGLAMIAQQQAQTAQMMQESAGRQEQLMQAVLMSLTAPKRIVRDEQTGKIVGAEVVMQ